VSNPQRMVLIEPQLVE